MISSTGSPKIVSSIASIGSCRTETEPMTGPPGRRLEVRQRPEEDLLRLRGLVVTLGVQQVELGGGRVQDDEAELHVAGVRRCRMAASSAGVGCGLVA